MKLDLVGSWGSQGKNTEVVCHSLLQWITFLSELCTITRPSWMALHGTQEPHEQCEKGKDRTLKNELSRSVHAQYATGDQWRNNSRKNEKTEPK